MVVGGKESSIIKQEYFQLAMWKKLDDFEECGQDHINAKASTGREKMLLHLSPACFQNMEFKKMKPVQWNLLCNSFDMRVL